MSQFSSTEQANKAANEAFERYAADKKRIQDIKERMKSKSIIKSVVTNDDIEWLLDIALKGIAS